MAVVLVGLVAAATAAGVAALSAQGRRTHAGRVDAQLRQLLLAGGADVAAHAAGWPAAVPTSSWSTPLPAELAGDAVQVRVTADPPEATVTATAEGRRLVQRVRLERSGDRWRVSTVTLDG